MLTFITFKELLQIKNSKTKLKGKTWAKAINNLQKTTYN
jgi:hypothetical protein